MTLKLPTRSRWLMTSVGRESTAVLEDVQAGIGIGDEDRAVAVDEVDVSGCDGFHSQSLFVFLESRHGYRIEVDVCRNRLRVPDTPHPLGSATPYIEEATAGRYRAGGDHHRRGKSGDGSRGSRLTGSTKVRFQRHGRVRNHAGTGP